MFKVKLNTGIEFTAETIQQEYRTDSSTGNAFRLILSNLDTENSLDWYVEKLNESTALDHIEVYSNSTELLDITGYNKVDSIILQLDSSETKRITVILTKTA